MSMKDRGQRMMFPRMVIAILLAIVLCGCKSSKDMSIPKPTHIPEQHKEAHRKLLREQHQLMIQPSTSSTEDLESRLPT